MGVQRYLVTMNGGLRIIVARKVVHLVFSLLLLIPLASFYMDFIKNVQLGIDPSLLAYVILTLCSSLINSVQIRFPMVREVFIQMFREMRKRILENVERVPEMKNFSLFFKEFDDMMSRYEERFEQFIERVERDYEKRYGYVCITFALLSVTLGYALFGYAVAYGILALAIVDSVSSIVTELTKNRFRRVFKHTLPSLAISYVVYLLIILILSRDIIKASILSLSAIVIELVSPEDNLTLPFFVTYIAKLLNINQIPL